MRRTAPRAAASATAGPYSTARCTLRNGTSNGVAAPNPTIADPTHIKTHTSVVKCTHKRLSSPMIGMNQHQCALR